MPTIKIQDNSRTTADRQGNNSPKLSEDWNALITAVENQPIRAENRALEGDA